MKSLKNNKVVLGLSGGVDSTATALLLKEKGYDVIGLYFDIKNDNILGLKKAQKVADELGIDLIYKNMSDTFEKCIISNFISEYGQGRTPNPCIICNPLIKFKVLLDTANEIGAAHIATGHYAKTGYSEIQKCHVIKNAINIKKDQSYMLYRLPEEIIEKIIFPLGEFESKDEIRDIARNMNLSNAEDKDSQEICFIDDNKSYIDYLKENGIESKKGNFIDNDGKILGEHSGIMNYTYGQRKGLGIALGKPAFVTDINVTENTVTLGDNEDLFFNKILIDDLYFTATDSNNIPNFALSKVLSGKIRYSAKASEARIIEVLDEGIIVEFTEKQRAATPGQSLVLYFENEVIGGGFIKSTIK